MAEAARVLDEAQKVFAAASTFADLPDEAVRRASILAALRTRPEGVTEAELTRICEWAVGLQVDLALLANMLGGNLSVHVNDGSEDPSFGLTPQGVERGRLLAAENDTPTA